MIKARLISLISGGIDSPVSTYKMAKAGAELILLYMDNGMYCDDRARENVISIVNRLRDITNMSMPLYFAPHWISQSAIHKNCDRSYQCVMCKRAMQKTAKYLAIKFGCSGVVMGDSLGQVASQTLKNIRSENIDLNFPIIRPLIGMDKIEIENIAKSIGTYKISIRPSCGCTIVPMKPITGANPDKIYTLDYATDIDNITKYCAMCAISK